MKRPPFILLFFSAHIAFIFLIVYKHSVRMQLIYEKQKQENIYAALRDKKEQLTHHLCALQDKKAIKTFAQQALNFKPITLSQIKTIKAHG